jgi:signal transduction histidine kinase
VDSNPERRARVLVVDDSRVIRRIVETELTKHGLTVQTADGGREALAALASWQPDVVVCDLNMPEMDGVELLARISHVDPQLPVIMYSDEDELARVLSTVHRGAFDFIPKSKNLTPLVTAVDRAARHRRLVGDNERLSAELRHLNEALEGRVAERTGELEAANRALDSSLKQLTQAQKQLVHSEKFAALGQLAAGVAHEINTPIQFIGDSVEFLKDVFAGLRQLVLAYRAQRGDLGAMLAARLTELEAEADLDYLLEHAPKALDRSEEGVARVAGIVRAMKEFAHPGETIMRPADLNQALRRTLTMVATEVKYVADVELELFEELPLVICNVGEINQVFLNLLVNAAHAVGDRVRGSDTRGRITVRTRHEGDDVIVTIADTGGGIPAGIRDRIFDPFFTTKEVGKGSGIGLAVARSVIIDKHGGDLSFETEEGVGTTFSIRLPLEGASS